MKNAKRFFGIIAMVAIIGFGFIACEEDSGSALPAELSGNTYTNSSGDKLVFGTNDLTVTLTGGEKKTFKYWEYNDGYLFFDNSRDEIVAYKDNTLGMVKLTFSSGQKILFGSWTKQ